MFSSSTASATTPRPTVSISDSPVLATTPGGSASSLSRIQRQSSGRGFIGRLWRGDTEYDDELRLEPPLTVQATKLGDRELHFDERIRTTCLVIVAAAVVYTAMGLLQSIMIPFIIAVALKYLLTPLIDLLSCRQTPSASGRMRPNRCWCRLPRPLAVLLSFFVAISLLISLAMVIGQSVEIFTERASTYRERVEAILELVFNVIEATQQNMKKTQEASIERFNELPLADIPIEEDPTASSHAHEALQKFRSSAIAFLQQVSLTDLILSLLGKAAAVAEDVMYIVLFLVFMLMHRESEEEEAANPDAFARTVDRQIFVYIRGKTSISAFVAITNGSILWLVGVDLFLAFGVLAFFLNFIPNIGMFTSVVLPMPLVALDPAFSSFQIFVAFLGPLCVGMIAKDVLEPLVLGHGSSLHPVSVLLAIMLFGSVWGVTGMVMAVPLTAVLRIYLSAIDHPLPRYCAHVLAGTRPTREEMQRSELV